MNTDISSLFKKIIAPVRFITVSRPRQLAPSARRPIVDRVLSMLVAGYEIATEMEVNDLQKHINSVPAGLRGLVYEGVYARLTMLDFAESNGGARVNAMAIAAPASAPQFNAGFGAALSDMEVEYIPDSLTTSFFGWIALHSLGVHDGYFRWPLTIEQQFVPNSIPPWARRGYDEGIGGALWYIGAANPKRIAQFIDRFPAERQPHLWDGVGMLIGYWGMDDEKDMRSILRLSKNYAPWLQQGVLAGLTGSVFNGSWSDHADGACNHILQARGKEVIDFTQDAISQIGEQFTKANQFLEWKSQLLETVNGAKLPPL